MQTIYDQNCSKCLKILQTPYIKCYECTNINLCLKCFSNGVQLFQHENSHKYQVISDNFPLFPESNWSASEEMRLLKGIKVCGYGNWEKISKYVSTKTKQECKEHYEHFYINNRKCELLPQFRNNESSKAIIVPYTFKLTGIDDPPRLAADTATYTFYSGYNPARSDFASNFDGLAETIVSALSKFDDSEEEDEEDDPEYFKNSKKLNAPKYEYFINDVKCAMFRIYNKRLKERYRRHAIIKRHGLINPRKHISSMYRFEEDIPKIWVDNMQIFMQFMDGIDFEYVMQNLRREYELKMQLSKLIDYRSKGIRSLHGISVYHDLLKKREKFEKSLKEFYNRPDLAISVVNNSNAEYKNPRRPVGPLDIVGLPDFEKLNEEEREFCRNSRFVPSSFLEFKKLLLEESHRNHGVLRLQDARRCIRIDVNKTRKLYDYLIDQGLIARK